MKSYFVIMTKFRKLNDNTISTMYLKVLKQSDILAKKNLTLNKLEALKFDNRDLALSLAIHCQNNYSINESKNELKVLIEELKID